MKKFLTLFLALLTFTAVSGGRSSFEPKQERKVVMGRNIALMMAKNGKVNFEIVASSTNVSRQAAEEAAAILGKAFSVKIPVKTKASGRIPAIIIGDAALAAKHGIDVKKMDRDGFVIKTLSNAVLIIGRDDPKGRPFSPGANKGYGRSPERGSLYGTYDFLERFAHVRFYFPGDMGTVIPRMKDWSLPTVYISDRPDFYQRRISAGKTSYEGLPQNAWIINRNRLRLETEVIPNCHGLALLQFIERFAKTNPEYFALQANGLRHFDTQAARPSSRKGHICFSSDIKKVIMDDAEAFLRGKDAKSRGLTYWSWSRFPKGMPYFNIMPNDCCYPCQCSKCKPHFSKGPEAGSDYIWSFFADIAKEMQKRKVPGYLTTMAYANYRNIPPFPIPENLLVMLALRGPWNVNTPLHAKDLKLLADWHKKLGGKTWLWTYPSKLRMEPGLPNTAPMVVGQFYKDAAPYIFGAYMEAETDIFMLSAINYYVFSRVAWNNSTDVKAVMDEFNRRMFGKASAPMAEFFVTLEKNWLAYVGRSVETPEGPVTIVPTITELWNRIWGPGELAKVDKLFARAETLVKNDKGSLARVRFIKTHIYGNLLKARNNWLKKVSANEHWKAVMPENKWGAPCYLVPMEGKAEVKSFVQLKRDKNFYYVKFTCEEPHTDAMIQPRRKNHDPKLWEDTSVEVQFDPAGEKKERFQLILTPAGVYTGLYHKVGVKKISPWNVTAKVTASIRKGKGFTIEAAIPVKSLPAAVPGKFKANFTRYRVLNGVKALPCYNWSFFAKSFGDLENFGTVVFEEPKEINLLADGNFTGRINGRWMGKWFSGRPLARDTGDFVTDGGSLVLKDGQLLAQYLKLKTNTKYKLTFWLKLEKDSEFNVRFDEHNGYVTMLPRRKLRGPLKWMRQEYIVSTHGKALGKNPYVRFQLHGKKGSECRLNGASLVEVK